MCRKNELKNAKRSAKIFTRYSVVRYYYIDFRVKCQFFLFIPKNIGKKGIDFCEIILYNTHCNPQGGSVLYILGRCLKYKIIKKEGPQK